MFQLKITARAKHQLKQISKIYQQQAVAAVLLEIREDPTIGKSLTLELNGLFSYKLGVYRIIYRIDQQNNSVVILRAGHRSVIYK